MKKQVSEYHVFQKRIRKARSSPLGSYIALSIGDEGFKAFITYEMITFFFGSIPGGLGLMLRKALYPRLLKSSGSGLVIGRNVILRHPGKLEIGKNVTIDDNVLIDARGDGNAGIQFSDEVVINRNCTLKAKTGSIRLGQRTNVGGGSVIVSYKGVEIGESVLIAGGCYINAGGYNTTNSSQSMMDQGVFSKDPILIGDDVWIATGAIILDGVKIGNHAVVGAGAVVTRDVSDYAIVAGVPARVVGNRLTNKARSS